MFYFVKSLSLDLTYQDWNKVFAWLCGKCYNTCKKTFKIKFLLRTEQWYLLIPGHTPFLSLRYLQRKMDSIHLFFTKEWKVLFLRAEWPTFALFFSIAPYGHLIGNLTQELNLLTVEGGKMLITSMSYASKMLSTIYIQLLYRTLVTVGFSVSGILRLMGSPEMLNGHGVGGGSLNTLWPLPLIMSVTWQ